MKQAFLKTMIGSLSLSALVGIYILLTDDLEGWVKLRILGTTFMFGIASLLAMSGAAMLEKQRHQLLGVITISVNILSLCVGQLLMWEALTNEEYWRFWSITIVLAIATSHVGMLLLLDIRKENTQVIRSLSIAAIAVLALMIIVLIVTKNGSEGYFRFMGAVSIADVLGTIVTLLLAKAERKEFHEVSSDRDQSREAYLLSLPRKRVSTAVIFRDEAGKILIVRPPYKRDFEIPGGVVEENESPTVACCRRVKEQLGLGIQVNQPLIIEYERNEYDDSFMFLFDGGILTAEAIANIQTNKVAIEHFDFHTIEEVAKLCKASLHRYIQQATVAIESGDMVYQEHGQ